MSIHLAAFARPAEVAVKRRKPSGTDGLPPWAGTPERGKPATKGSGHQRERDTPVTIRTALLRSARAATRLCGLAPPMLGQARIMKTYLIALLLLAAGACGSSGKGDSDGATGGDAAGGQDGAAGRDGAGGATDARPRGCVRNDECPTGQVCYAGVGPCTSIGHCVTRRPGSCFTCDFLFFYLLSTCTTIPVAQGYENCS